MDIFRGRKCGKNGSKMPIFGPFPQNPLKFYKKEKVLKKSLKSNKTFWHLFLGELGEDFIKSQVNMGVLYISFFSVLGERKRV